jgi:hypothetical protein
MKCIASADYGRVPANLSSTVPPQSNGKLDLETGVRYSEEQRSFLKVNFEKEVCIFLGCRMVEDNRKTWVSQHIHLTIFWLNTHITKRQELQKTTSDCSSKQSR